MSKTERWVDIPDYIGIYQVSSFGRVRSLSRYIRCKFGKRKIPGKIIKQSIINSNYKIVGLSKNGTSDHILVHRLVLLAFVGQCPPKMQCRHLDGDKHNNRLSNLTWGTSSQDQEDRRRHGTMPTGEDISWALFKNFEIAEIHEMYNQGFSQSEIAHKFNTSQSIIGRILRGATYKKAQPSKKTKIRPKGAVCGVKNPKARAITFEGETMTIRDWAKKMNLHETTLYSRICRWGIEKAMSTPKLRTTRKP